MTETQFLLIQLASEAAEVAHIATKAAQFGADEVMPGQPLTNAERVMGEVIDFYAVWGMLHRRGITKEPPPKEYAEMIERKRVKVARYMAFALNGAPHPMASDVPAQGGGSEGPEA